MKLAVHGVTYLRTIISIFTVVRTSNLLHIARWYFTTMIKAAITSTLLSGSSVNWK